MPNGLAKKCAIGLQSFAKGCIACNGGFPFSAPGPVVFPALCAGSGVAQKRQKNAEGLGRRSAFFWGTGRSARQLAEGGPGLRRISRQLKAVGRCRVGLRYKKGGFPRRRVICANLGAKIGYRFIYLLSRI